MRVRNPPLRRGKPSVAPLIYSKLGFIARGIGITGAKGLWDLFYSGGLLKLNGAETEPSGLRTVRIAVEPGAIFFAAFLQRKNPVGSLSSFKVPCSSPFTSTTAPMAKLCPKTNSFFALA